MSYTHEHMAGRGNRDLGANSTKVSKAASTRSSGHPGATRLPDCSPSSLGLFLMAEAISPI